MTSPADGADEGLPPEGERAGGDPGEPARARPPMPQPADELRLVLAKTPIALWSVDRSLRLTHTAASGLVALERRDDAGVGWSILDRLGATDPANPVIAAHRRALAGESVTTELEIAGRIFHTHLEPLRDDDDQVVGVMGVGLDISDRRRKEVALRESEDRYRLLIELSPEPIAVHAEGRFLYANPAVARLLGVPSPDELVGRAMLDYLDPAQHEVVRERLERVYGDGEIAPLMRMRVIRPDGEVREVELTSTPIPYEGRRAALSVARDVTARLSAERALVESHALLDAVFHGSSDCILVRDMEGRFRLANPAAERMLGFSSDTLLGATPEELAPPETARQVRANDERVLAEGRSRMFEEPMVVHGQRRTFQTVRTPLFDARGQPLGVVAIARDITDEHRLEEKLRQAQKLEAVGRLARGIAHDFNNLLAIISSYADFLLRSLDTGDPRRFDAQEIRGAADRAAALTRQLLLFGRNQVAAPRVLDLNEAVAGMERMLRLLIVEGIDLRTELAPEPALVRADPGQLEQLLLNLAMNSRDAMPDGGVLSISTATRTLDAETAGEHGALPPGGYVELAVSDTGSGMDAETMSHIFEPFFTTKPPGKGTGLGLPTVYAIVERSNGHVEVTSAPGEGTTVRILLPRAAPESGAAEEQRRTATILVVEGEAGARDGLRRLLEGEGYMVLAAADAAAARRMMREHEGVIDLLLADASLPDASGAALADEVTALRPGARVLLLAAASPDMSPDRMIAWRGAGVVSKSARPELLLERVRASLAAGA
ncbi:MAG TPA: PAS domain S-box protein [Gemmatimonadaceae bacterium]|nr:PAS domain S-box protein [Gemmatimonadaceae bacterium]